MSGKIVEASTTKSWDKSRSQGIGRLQIFLEEGKKTLPSLVLIGLGERTDRLETGELVALFELDRSIYCIIFDYMDGISTWPILNAFLSSAQGVASESKSKSSQNLS